MPTAWIFSSRIFGLRVFNLWLWRFLTRCFTRKVHAFSLLETSVVLLIMGVTLSFSLPYLSSQLDMEKRRKTEASFEEVAYALSQFVLQYGRLPRPSNVTASGEFLGKEDDGTLHTGIVPYKTLGISPSMARDGYQHWLSYTPHPELCEDMVLSKDPVAEENSFCKVSLEETMKVVGKDNDILSGESELQPVFMLVSHGKKGGDFTEQGHRRPFAEKLPGKSENTNGDLIFSDMHLSKNSEDVLFWKNRFMLLAAYAHTTCK